ncbi:MAG: sigma 54-interacting transcriptional regulator [Isosphaeraceae bacterium]|nr:sigma 54-interacting transcriptional regulator [Isosphaeraceae bacterium]
MKAAPPPLFAPRADRAAPLLGVIADSGQLTRLAVKEGADCLLALSAGIYRNLGVSALAAFLPFGNSNDQTEALVERTVLPASGDVPVIAGLLASDPTAPLADRLQRLRRWGVRGITNYPSASLLEGTLRQVFETEGCTIDAEVELLAEARKQGLATVAFAGTEPGAAARFAGSGVDALILTPGQTQLLDDIHERRDRLQEAIRQLKATLAGIKRKHPRLLCLVFGGPITLPEDLEQVYRQTSFDGFVGGSVFGRYPVESGVAATLRRFKSVVVPAAAAGESALGPMIGASRAMQQLFRLVRRVAACDLNVCVEGESGVGKELVATHIHQLSARSHGALVTLNCGAISESLLESELFGHERGSFTGADHRRLGKFELAHNGTLFLDEVGDLSPRGQVALLRAIQQREITRVGGDRSIPVNVRVLSASNQPLSALVAQGRFRADLYYRLNTLTLSVPPLRERLDDIPLLVEPILAALRVQMGHGRLDLSPHFHAKLRRHDWTGNLRELQHVIAQAALLEEGPVLNGTHFEPMPGATFNAAATTAASGASHAFVARHHAERRERAHRALADARGNKSRAAETLGVSRKTFYAWLRDESDGAP